MRGFDMIFTVLGALLIIVVCVDIFLTVLHPTIESPLSNRFQQIIWQGLRVVERVVHRYQRKMGILDSGLPLMVAGLIIFWLMLLGFGFACLYYHWIGDPNTFRSSNPIEGSFFDALYYSGVTLATLGYGDIQPISIPFRALAVIEAITGAITISAGVAYILAVYPALNQQRTIARALNAEVAGQSDALPMLRRYRAADGQWHSELFTQLRDLALALLDITESHETHSVLYYAHPRHVQHSFLRVLITAQSLVAILRYGLSVDRYPDTVKHPHVLLLEQSLHYSLHRLSMSIHIPETSQAHVPVNQQSLAEEYRTVCNELEQIGLTSARLQRSAGVPVLVESDAERDTTNESAEHAALVDGSFEYNGEPNILDPALDLASQSSEAAFVVFRLQTDPLIAAYAVACSYVLDDARASYSTMWWTGRDKEQSTR